MKNTIAGVCLILASVVCVILLFSIERPHPSNDPASPGGAYSGPSSSGFEYGRYYNWISWAYFPRYQEYEPPVVSPDPNDESVKAINAALDCYDIRLNIDDTTTFADLFLMIKAELRRLEMQDIHIELHRRVLRDYNEIRSDVTLLPPGERFDPPPMRFSSALSRLLEPLDLTYTIRDETFMITTEQEVRREQERVWEKEQVDKWEKEKKDIFRKIDPERKYETLVACLVFAWILYFFSGICFFIFGRSKVSS